VVNRIGHSEGGGPTAPDLFGDYSHDELVRRGGEEKGDEHGAGAREMV